MNNKKSIIPFLVLLILLFGVSFFLRKIESQNENRAVTITLRNDPSLVHGTDIWQYETDNYFDFNKSLLNDLSYKEGQSHYKAGDYSSAHQSFLSLKVNYPDDPIVTNYLGLIALNSRDYRKASTYFKQILNRKEGNYAPALLNLGILAARQEKFNEAKDYYRKATSVDPLNPRPYYNLGLLEAKNDNWKVADSLFNKSASYSSGFLKAKSMYYRSKALLQLGNKTLAKRLIEEAINLKPDYLQARVQRSLLIGHLETRKTELNKVLRLYPNSAIVHYHLGKLHEDLGENKKASMYYSKALALGSNDSDIKDHILDFYLKSNQTTVAEELMVSSTDTLSPRHDFFVAKLAYHKGDYPAALESYKTAFNKSNKQYVKPLVNMGIIYRKQGHMDSSLLMYKKALEIRNDYPAAYFNLAYAYNQLGKDSLAIYNYKNSLTFDPGNPKIWYNLGNTYKENDKKKEAIAAYKRAIAIDVDYKKALLQLGVVYSSMNNYKLAIETYDDILKICPRYTKAWYNLGIAYAKIGESNKAILALEQVIKFEPSHLKSLKKLGFLYAEVGNQLKAIASFNGALDQDLNDPDLRYFIALEYYKVGNLTEAMDAISKALSLNGNMRKAIELKNKILTQKAKTS